MAEGGTVVVELEPKLDKGKTKSQFGSLAGIASKAFVAAFAAKQVFDIGAGLINAAEEYGSLVSGAENLIEQQQKALGDQATLTTDHLTEQADALQRLTGFSNEQILTGERQLLSFQNIQNAGEGTEAIYDRTTAALGDLVASGALSDFNSGAIQLGKALNDPTKGISALGRAGIQFTESQKDQIKGLQESGDLLGAQKIILDELEGVYGGTAEAQRDSTDVIKNAWQDLQVSAGNVLLPLVEKIASFIVDKAIPAFKEWVPHIKRGAQVLADAWKAAWVILKPVWDAIKRAIETVRAIFQRDGDKMTAKSQEVFDKLKPVWEGLVELFTNVFEAIGVIFNFYITLYETIWNNFGDEILSYLGIIWDAIAGTIEGALEIINGILDVFIGIFEGDWERVWNGLIGIFEGAWTLLTTTVQTSIDALGLFFIDLPLKILGWLGDLGSTLLNAGKDLIAGFLNGIKEKAGEIGSTIKNFVTAPIPGWIKGPLGIGSPSKLTMGFGENIAEGMALGIASGAEDIQRATNAMIPALTGAGAGGLGGTSIVINNPTNRTTNSGIQKGLALGRLMGA